MAKMDVGQQLLELQIKEKCGNRVVKVTLDRIQVSGSVHNPKNHNEPCSSSETSLQNQDRSFRDVGRPSIESAPNLDQSRNRPQRKITKSYTQYFEGGNDSSDDEYIESDVSGSDSEQKDTSHSEFKPSPLKKAKRKTKNSKKIYSNVDPGETAKELEIGKTEPKIACSVCNQNLLGRHMKTHFQRKHPSKKLPAVKYKAATIPCVFCPVSVTYRHRWVHLQRKHPEQLVKGDLDEPRKVKCDLCPSVFLLEELYVHKKTLHPHNVKVKATKTKASLSFQCVLCPGKFKTQNGLENHILNFHVVDKPFECDICHKSFLTEELLQKHIKVTHEAKSFSCRFCPTKSFKDSTSLKKHIETIHRSYSCSDHCESESTSNNLLCPVCATHFTTESDLVKHLQKPRLKSVMKCKLCSEPVYTPCRLNVHLHKMHSATLNADASDQLKTISESAATTQEPNSEKITKIFASVKNPASSLNTFSCVVCSADFSRRCDLDFHELHEKHRRWKCPICKKLVRTKVDLKSHIQSVHSDARPFKCTHQGCSKSFKGRKELKKHMAMHDPDRVYCQDCFKYFTKEAFTLHVANKHRADQVFKCDVCSKTWGALKRLKQHLLMHTDERPFPCKFCNLKYKSAREANGHTKKCQVWTEDQREKYAERSRMAVQQAKTRKPRIYISGRGRKLTDQTVKLEEGAQATRISTNEFNSAATSINGNGTDLELVKEETVEATPIFTSKSTCGTPDLNDNETHSTLIKQEVDLKYLDDNSSELLDQPTPEPELCVVKLEIIPKQET